MNGLCGFHKQNLVHEGGALVVACAEQREAGGASALWEVGVRVFL